MQDKTSLVLGPSGSGKSTALDVLEDNGFYCIDNLPAILLPELAERAGLERAGAGARARAASVAGAVRGRAGGAGRDAQRRGPRRRDRQSRDGRTPVTEQQATRRVLLVVNPRSDEARAALTGGGQPERG